MGQFILKSFFFSTPIVVVGLLAELLLRQIPNDYSFKKEFLDQNSNSIEVLFLGSSHTFYGVNPKYIKLKSFNASHVSQSIDYDYEILNKYKDNWRNLKCILVPIDYSTLFKRTGVGAEAWRVKNYKLYYEIDSDSHFNLTYSSEVLTHNLKVNFVRLYRQYFSKKGNLTCDSLGYGTKQIFKDLSKSGKIAASRHTAVSNNFYKSNIETLKSILSLSKSLNIKVILYTNPAYHTYRDNINKKQLSLTYQAIQEIVRQDTSIAYINFLPDPSFNASCFADADHLNKIGAQILTLKLDSLINKAIGF